MEYGAQVLHLVGLVCMSILDPGGSIGVLFKSNWPSTNMA